MKNSSSRLHFVPRVCRVYLCLWIWLWVVVDVVVVCCVGVCVAWWLVCSCGCVVVVVVAAVLCCLRGIPIFRGKRDLSYVFLALCFGVQPQVTHPHYAGGNELRYSSVALV